MRHLAVANAAPRRAATLRLIALMAPCPWCLQLPLRAMSKQAAGSSPSISAHGMAGMAGVVAGVMGASCVAFAMSEVADGLHAAHYPWPHDGPFDSYDHASIRRGHQVYMQVRCSDG